MRPKGKLFALILMFAAVGLLTATGAFTTVEADRTAEVNVTGDANALIGLEAGADNPGYVNNVNGEVEIALDNPSGTSADGVNYNATTEIDRVLNITNNGANGAEIHINVNGSNRQYVEVYNATDTDPYATNITNGKNKITVGSGNKIQISIKIDTPEASGSLSGNEELISRIEIVANST